MHLPEFQAFQQWMQREFKCKDFEEIFDILNYEEALLLGHKLNYNLVDARVYDALPADSIEAYQGLPAEIRVLIFIQSVIFNSNCTWT